MSFDEWNDDNWKVTRRGDLFVLNAPNVQYIFNEHDFIQLVGRINKVNIFEKDTWFVHDGTINNIETGEQLIGTFDYCYQLNELEHKNKELTEFKGNVENTLRGMYHSEKTEFGKKIIGNIMDLLGVEE